MPLPPKEIRYADAGVSIEAADQAVARIKTLARQTFTKSVLTDIGSFGAGFRLAGYKRPVLISSADGVGTKLKVAFLAKIHNTVGEDLVNHCVNDIMVQGATPLFFLDYFAVGKLNPMVAAQVVEGIARGCSANQCSLIGGETAEMPGLYAPGEYDLAGFIVGVVEQDRLLTGARIKPGDLLYGLASNGLHTNGYSLARKLLFEKARLKVSSYAPELDGTLGRELLKVHKSYKPAMDALMKARLLKGAAHITGGGITDNTPRILPAGLGVRIDVGSWPIPPIFEMLRRIGRIPLDDWRRTFNLGVGMIVVISEKDAGAAKRILKRIGDPFYKIGEVVKLKRGAAERVLYDE